tara:strand:- start:311 stop:1060 length:750 start_codon:yes stop_codon:yes gene_type:complete
MHTKGQRIYAIGDIHGCRDAFAQMRAAIAADLAAHPHANPLAITLGDYVDRGADSAGVLDDLIAWHNGPLPVVSLRGNHDTYPEIYLNSPQTTGLPHLHWLDPRMGGNETLRSYGVEGASADAPIATHRAAAAAIPEHHLRFIAETCRLTHHVGDYLFVHAGIHPDAPLHDQDENDLIWIREPFLSHRGDFGATVVHGHTPVQDVEHHGNRIAVDTGAVFGRFLSCVIIEDASVNLLQPQRQAGRIALR